MKRIVVFVLIGFLCLFTAGRAQAACSGTIFADVTSGGFCDFIERFFSLGITGGCTSDNPATAENERMYCSDSPVTRGQMAVFMTTLYDSVGGGSGGSGGTVTQVNSGAGLTGGPITTAGTLSVDFGTGANQVAAGNHTHNYDSAYVNTAGDTMTGTLGWGSYDVGLDATGALSVWGPQAQFRVIGTPNDVIKIGNTTECGVIDCGDWLDIRLGDSSADRVIFGTDNVTYANPKTRKWSVRGADFVPYDETGAFTKSYATGLSATDGAFTAPVHLPDGAVVTKVRINIYDNDATNDIFVYLDRSDMQGSSVELASVGSSASSTSWRGYDDTTISNSTIDNATYAYGLYVNPMFSSTDLKLGGVVIEYTVTEPLP